MYFDGASFREGLGAGIMLISHVDEVVTLIYRVEFEVTNIRGNLGSKMGLIRKWTNNKLL